IVEPVTAQRVAVGTSIERLNIVRDEPAIGSAATYGRSDRMRKTRIVSDVGPRHADQRRDVENSGRRVAVQGVAAAIVDENIVAAHPDQRIVCRGTDEIV